MTKFIDSSRKSGRKSTSTIFTHKIDLIGQKVIKTNINPNDFDIVEYLGTNSTKPHPNKDIFRCRDKSRITWGFFIGIKGDEF